MKSLKLILLSLLDVLLEIVNTMSGPLTGLKIDANKLLKFASK